VEEKKQQKLKLRQKQQRPPPAVIAPRKVMFPHHARPDKNFKQFRYICAENIDVYLKKKPRFFCDNCNYEVDIELKACPYCARHFSSVRCPSCSFYGPDEMFRNGCPMCGYSASPSKAPKIQEKTPKRKERASAEPLPFWTYVAAFFTLFAVIIFFSFLLTR
jgi:hypothetical protein